jgi:multidrug efflux system membrane fusion protein
MTTLLSHDDLKPRGTGAPRAKSRRRGWLVAAVLLLASGALYWRIAGHTSSSPGAAVPPGDAGEIPVLVAPVETKDVTIYLDGLGTAQASQTVTVKPQVDGVLQEVRFKEGQDVHAGEVLARIDPRTYQASLDQAVAKKAQDAANLANARVDLGRYQKLAATAYTSAQQADTQKATVAQLEAQVAQDQAQIDNARAQLSYCTITAPIDGRAGIRQVDAGNLVHASDTTGLVVLTTLKPISVVFTLPQQDLPQVSTAMAAGSPAVLALPQTPDGAANAAPLDRGALTVLDNQVDQTTGTIKLKATFPNEKLQLWPGAFLTVRLQVDVRHGAVVVPPVAVQRGPLGTYVYVVNGDLSVTRRPVKVGHEDASAAIILDGVKPGDRVVTDGASRVSEGSKVSIAEPVPATVPR